MDSPPSSNSPFKVSPFTPSHHLRDHLLSFTDVLLSNIQEWSNPHPPWPPPPRSLSFLGSDRFIKGRLPDRTAAISESLSSFFSHVEPFCDAVKHGDGHNQMQVDRNLFQIHDVAHNDDDDAPTNDGSGSTAPATSCDQTSYLPSNSKLALLYPQGDESAQGGLKNDTDTNDTVKLSTHSLEAEKDCVHPLDADPAEILPSHEEFCSMDGNSQNGSKVKECNDGSPKVLTVGSSVFTQPKGLDCTFSVAEPTYTTLPNAETPVNSQHNEEVHDLEEGELLDGLPDGEHADNMEEDTFEREANIEKENYTDDGRFDMEEGSPSCAHGLERKVVESGTDDEMNEPISSFVSWYRTHSLNLAKNKKANTNGELSKKTNSGKKRKSVQEPQLLEEAFCVDSRPAQKIEHAKILQQGLSIVVNAANVNEGERLGMESVSIEAMSDVTNNQRVDGAMAISSEVLVQQGHGGSELLEKRNGLSPFVADDALHLPTNEAEKNGQELASQEMSVAKKKKRGPLTEARRKKRQKAKHRAQERKQEQQGIRRLKIKPCIETNERKKRTCTYYVQGKCGKGASCTFLHDVTPITKSEVCKYFVMNCCLKGDDCPYSHNLSSFPCKYFHTRGRCMEGDSCRFSHEPMSEEAKQAFLQRIEEEQVVRQAGIDGLGRAAVNLAMSSIISPSSEKFNSNKLDVPAMGRGSVTDLLPAKPHDGSDYLTPVSARKRMSTSAIGAAKAVNKSGKRLPFWGGLHGSTKTPQQDEGCEKGNQALVVESGQPGLLAMSFPGNAATTQERRTKAEAFVRAQLHDSRLLHSPRLAMGMENNKQVSCTPANQPRALPMRSIRVSSMSALSNSDAKPVELNDSSHQNGSQDGLLIGKSTGTGVSLREPSPTLLDLLLRPHEKDLSKEKALTSRMPLGDDKAAACTKSRSSMFWDRFLK